MTNKTKKINKMEYADFCCKPGKLVSNLKMNIMKMGKTLEFEMFMVIFPKI